MSYDHPSFTLPPVHEPGDQAISELEIPCCQARPAQQRCHGCHVRSAWHAITTTVEQSAVAMGRLPAV